MVSGKWVIPLKVFRWNVFSGNFLLRTVIEPILFVNSICMSMYLAEQPSCQTKIMPNDFRSNNFQPYGLLPIVAQSSISIIHLGSKAGPIEPINFSKWSVWRHHDPESGSNAWAQKPKENSEFPKFQAFIQLDRVRISHCNDWCRDCASGTCLIGKVVQEISSWRLCQLGLIMFLSLPAPFNRDSELWLFWLPDCLLFYLFNVTMLSTRVSGTVNVLKLNLL